MPSAGSVSKMDKYERMKLLGKGSFGKAWRVRDRNTLQEYVAKQIKCESKQDLQDALAEAAVLEKMDHPCIVMYREVIRNSPKLVTIVMEFCAGGDVAEKIARRKFRNQYFDEGTIKFWFVQTADAINYLHLKGILHRDIKTANLFLSATGNVKLGDFGIARILDRNAAAPSERTARTPVGTPMFMAPEICGGNRYGQKADIWALGCVLYEMAALRPAFMAYSMESLMAKIKRGNHDRHLPRIYSPDLKRVLSLLLAVDPRARPTASELLENAYFADEVRRNDAYKSGTAAAPAPHVPDPIESRSSKPDILVIDDAGAHHNSSAPRPKRGSVDPWRKRPSQDAGAPSYAAQHAAQHPAAAVAAQQQAPIVPSNMRDHLRRNVLNISPAPTPSASPAMGRKHAAGQQGGQQAGGAASAVAGLGGRRNSPLMGRRNSPLLVRAGGRGGTPEADPRSALGHLPPLQGRNQPFKRNGRWG